MLFARYPNAEIWLYCGEYFVYGRYDSGDPVITDSEGYAREVAASC